MGGIAWSGLDTMVEMYGITDLDGLIERLIVIKSHEPKKGGWSD